jgi:hypothetical protein
LYFINYKVPVFDNIDFCSRLDENSCMKINGIHFIRTCLASKFCFLFVIMPETDTSSHVQKTDKEEKCLEVLVVVALFLSNKGDLQR